MNPPSSHHPSPSLDQRGLPHGSAPRPDWETTPREVRAALSNPPTNFVLVDCRRDDERRVAHIDGSVHIALADIERRADELELDDGSRDRPIVVHCHHGMRSLKAVGALRALGFTNARSMFGGIDLWSIDIDHRVPRY